MRKFAFILLLLVFRNLNAQDKEDIDLESFAEQRFQVQDADVNYADLYESLLLYYTNPINLNKTNRTELASLYILSPIQLESFFDYREKRGELISIYELQAVPNFDMGTIRDLLPFVTVTEAYDPRPLTQRILSEPNNYLLLRYYRNLETEEGYKRNDSTGYLGDPNTVYGRFRVSHPEDFSINFTFEKDAGEQFAVNPSKKQYGFDFYSGHLFVQNQGKLKSLVIGDYKIQMGQGLVFGANFRIGQGAQTVNTVKGNSIGIRPYASVLETNFFRGAAATVSFGKVDVTAFTSSLLQDGTISNDTTSSDFNEYANSIQSTGYHRTQTELAAKNTIRENDGGVIVEYSNHKLTLGVSSLYSHFSKPLQKQPNNYNQYEFSGNENLIGSIFGSYNWQNFILFGEAAQSSSGGIGAIGGLLVSLTPQIDFSWSIRHYDKNFHSFYGNGFGENSRTINEKGIYWGLMVHPNRHYQFAAYFDKFSFPWLMYRVDAPSHGYEYLGRFTYKPTRSITMYAQFRQENKQRSFTEGGSNLSLLSDVVRRNYIVNVDYAIGRTFSFKTRVQGASYQQQRKTTHGIALVQDVNMSFWKMKLSTRYALFDTDDYNTRQYIYEKNVLYAFSIPAYSGTGVRSYIMLQYNASKSTTFWIRYSRFKYNNQTTVGSGLSQINGNLKSDIRLMLRYKFRS